MGDISKTLSSPPKQYTKKSMERTYIYEEYNKERTSIGRTFRRKKVQRNKYEENNKKA